MRSRSSSAYSNRSMEEVRPKLKEEPHLSGAYIRSLVKQLSSSMAKENPKSPDELPGELAKLSEALGEAQQQQQQPQPPPQPKKQVRRRLHTTRPYQERLLNMAEARREIVAALKFHRAAMKQANEQQQEEAQPTPTPPPQSYPPPSLENPHQELMDSMINTRIYPANPTLPNYFRNPTFSPFTYPSPFSWPYPPIASLPICDNLNLPLPNQPLGLNLNFQGFNNIETSLYNSNKPSIQQSLASPSSSSSSSYSYSLPSPPAMSGLEVPSISNEPQQGSEAIPDPAGLALHPAMDDEEMAEIRSIGEQHGIEWNDTMNVVTSAWWCKFLKSMEAGSEEKGGGGRREGDGFPAFDEIMGMPVWLNDSMGGDANESCLFEQPTDDFHTEDYLQDATLPCLDIGGIEGLDGEWLS